MNNIILVTGGAGFIGYHTAKLLISQGHEVVAVDNFNDYYDPKLKWQRADALKALGAKVYNLDLTYNEVFASMCGRLKPRIVIHLAAQAGVRYSQVNPMAYTQSNLVGMTSVLNACKYANVEHLLYASSSSVYGNTAKVPVNESDPTDNPLSYYAVTKKSNELAASVFTLETGIPATGMRFFTVYGPMGRPDMAYWTFADKILRGETLTVYGNNVARDFTYCDDVAIAISKLMQVPKAHNIVNIGNSNPHTVMELVGELEMSMGCQAVTKRDELPSSDPQITFCDNSYLEQLTGYKPTTSFQYGIYQFAQWFMQYKTQL